MANITIVGIIDSIKYLPNNGGCLVFLSEFKKGYRKSNGEVVDDKFLSWKCIFKQGLVNYINGHFNNGMVVEVKGEAFPYAIDHDQVIDGYSVMGQTMNMFSIPRPFLRMERKMQKESLLHSTGVPNPNDFNEPDF
jgi:hypothetical protein